MYRPDCHIAGGLEQWRSAFPEQIGADTNTIIESTPGYLYSQTALEHIPRLPSTPRCLFILREPAAQVYSLYTYFRDNWDWIPADMSFAGFLDAVRAGNHEFNGNELARNALHYAKYVDHLLPWRERLGPERMKVTTYDRLQADPAGLVHEIASWLGLDPSFYESYGFPRENETYQPRSRALQRVNIAVRRLLPKGGAYQGLRRMYRLLNTTRPDRQSEENARIVHSLRAEFQDANSRLASEFDLDLHAWSGMSASA